MKTFRFREIIFCVRSCDYVYVRGFVSSVVAGGVVVASATGAHGDMRRGAVRHSLSTCAPYVTVR